MDFHNSISEKGQIKNLAVGGALPNPLCVLQVHQIILRTTKQIQQKMPTNSCPWFCEWSLFREY